MLPNKNQDNGREVFAKCRDWPGDRSLTSQNCQSDGIRSPQKDTQKQKVHAGGSRRSDAHTGNDKILILIRNAGSSGRMILFFQGSLPGILVHYTEMLDRSGFFQDRIHQPRQYTFLIILLTKHIKMLIKSCKFIEHPLVSHTNKK